VVDEFLTVAEVAELLKLNQQTVRNWIDRGELAAIRVGRRVRIRREELERLLQNRYEPKLKREPEPEARATAEEFWTGGIPSPPESQGS
jgi:excisionase family DNA binding protein